MGQGMSVSFMPGGIARKARRVLGKRDLKSERGKGNEKKEIGEENEEGLQKQDQF